MIRKAMLTAVLLLAASTLLYSFRTTGGEGFEIYIDNKLVLQQFNQEMKQVKQIQLNAAQQELQVKYYHCGMAGKNRVLELKKAGQEVVKHWQFNNSEGKNFAITVAVKDILASQKKAGTAAVSLYYSSKEAPQGRLLATIFTADMQAAVRK
ncbi:hypothetical protein IQ13_3109 [Lacibacter cauensis]|uniref:Uncharacterized protein n=1 Tax=Lacibacter cauensis TaxID=510947 RepID=A0A562SGR0_9BACT|nr:hypothetical protein [Lacibacter cauensis]TWI80432.1 hypothetical protein IQ13_3109 [Lacibacter cauensis]